MEKEIWIDKHVWEEEFGGELPSDMEDLDELEEASTRHNTEFKKAEFISEFEL
ncbi:hypothetical protein [Paenibacillus amylolyticus]|uniref:hypothetical protein n=1 Tax=Paenibacillus amylolyticus TaxID=1451 RepID=UPI00158E3692|nr:hypothetical protein [Paenibacillus amylolyticus]